MMSNIFRKVLLIVLIAPIVGLSQDIDYYNRLKHEYRNEDAVIVENIDEITIDLVNNDLEIYNSHFEKRFFISDKTSYYADDYIYYSFFTEIEDIKAYLYEYNGKGFKKQRVTDITTQNRYSTSIFYDDNMIKKIVFPNFSPFSYTTISYKEKIKDPHFLGKYFFTSFVPSEKNEVRVRCHKDVVLKYKLFNTGKYNVEEVIKDDGTYKIYTWRLKKAPKYVLDEESYSIHYIEPHVVLYIGSYKVEGKSKTVLSSTSDLYNWYYSMTSEVNSQEAPELKALADSLTANCKTEEEIVKSVYYWVQENIKYVAFEDGYSGFIPREAKDIYHKRYGDCKDMSSIMNKIFSYTPVESHLTWVGTRDIPYSYNELPTTSVDNHMVLAVKLNDTIRIIDGTATYQPMNLPTSFIIGKEAMVGIDSANFLIHKVRIPHMDESYAVDSIILEFQDNSLHGEASVCYTGYFKTNIGTMLKRRPESKYQELLSDMLETGSNKFKLNDFEIYGLHNRDTTLRINYQFELNNYAKQIGNELYVNLNLDKALASSKIDIEKQNYNEKMEFKRITSKVVELKIPNDYMLKHIPGNSEYQNSNFGYSLTYQHNKARNSVLLEQRIYIDTIDITKEQFGDWNNMVAKLNEAYSQAFILEKK